MSVDPEYWTLLGAPRIDALSELLHENTKISPAARGFVISAEARAVMGAGFKTYDSADFFALPSPQRDVPMSVDEAIRARKSERSYGNEPLSLAEAGTLLFHAGGLLSNDHELPRRSTPSAGGLYPLEIYSIILNVHGLERGVYHYNIARHGLERLSHPVDLERLRSTVFVDGLAETASMAIVITAVFGRTKIKYGERGYRFALLEAGHVVQNLLLMTTALHLGSCPIGGFVDDYINDLVDVDGLDEATLYLVFVGSSTNISARHEAPASESSE